MTTMRKKHGEICCVFEQKYPLEWTSLLMKEGKLFSFDSIDFRVSPTINL